MTKRLISFLIALCIFIAIPLSARYKYNPFTRKLDYYETGADIDLGDLADVTLTGLATGNVLYYDGSAWVNLATGANTQFLTLAAGIPAWQAIPAGVTTFVGLNDTPANYVGKAGQLVRVNAGANALEFFAGSPLGTVIIADGADGWTKTENFRVSATGVVNPGTWQGTAIANTYIAGINQNLLTTSTPTFDDVTVTNPVNVYALSHNSFTDYAANEHVVLPGTIANVLSDHNLAAHTALGILSHWQDVFIVAKSGGDYTSIQTALTAQTAGGETFLVGPGTYTDTISFTANDQVVKALGRGINVIVTQADANIVDAGAFTNCRVEDIGIRLTAPTTAINAIQVGTGSLILIDCKGYLATAVALVQADQPSLTGFTGAGEIVIRRGRYEYYHTGVAGGTAIKTAFRANVNLAYLHMHKIDQITITNSGTALATALFVTTGTAVTEMHNCVDIIVTDPNSTLVVGLGYMGGGGAHNIQGNHVDVIATANTSYGLYHDGTATVRSSFNALHASDTGGTSRAFYVGGSATLNSHFDDLRSDDGNNVTGTLIQVNSPADGDHFISDELDVIGVSEFSGDTNQYEDVFVSWDDAADRMVIDQDSEEGTEDQPLVLIDDSREGTSVDEPGEASLKIQSEGYGLSVIGDNYFEGDIEFKDDLIATWGSAADHAAIAQSAVAGTEDVPLINIDDDRTGDTANELSEATIYLDADGVYAFYIADGDFRVEDIFEYDYTTDHNLLVGYLAGEDLTAGQGTYNTLVGEQAGADITTGDTTTIVGYQAGFLFTVSIDNVAIGNKAAYGTDPDADTKENVVIGREAFYTIGAGAYGNVVIGDKAFYEGGSNSGPSHDNVVIGDDAMGAVEPAEDPPWHNVVIGSHAGYGTAEDNPYFNNTIVGSYAGYALEMGSQNTIIGAYAAEDITSGADNIVIGYMAGEGWLDTESEKLVIDVTDTATPLIYGDFSTDNISINGDFNVLMDDALDQILIQQLAVEGTEDQPLIFIDDDRVGVTTQEESEATIIIDTAALRAIYITGGTYGIELDGSAGLRSAGEIYAEGHLWWGARVDSIYSSNAGQDSLWTFRLADHSAADSSAIYFGSEGVFGSTSFNDWTSATFVLTNNNGADLYDWAAVAIGPRIQPDVTVAHYFDFYAFTGCADGTIDPTATEIPPTFRFGDSGSAVPNHATGPGDVLFEDDIEVDGVSYFGDATNYASFAVDGTLTLAGTARVTTCYQIANASLGSGGTKPDEAIVGNYWGWSYDKGDDSVFTVKLADNYASGTDVTINIRWAINEAYATANGEVRWQATWSAHPANATEAIDDAGTTDDSGDINIPATAYFLTQTLIETIPGGSLSPGDEIGITIERIDLTDGNDPTADPVITCVGIGYTLDKLGI